MSTPKPEYQKVGRFGKTHGLSGAIRLIVEEDFLDAVLKAEVVFAPLGGHPVPFFPDGVVLEAPLVMQFEDLNSKEEAQEIAGLDLLLRSEEVDALTVDDFRLLEGFLLEDETAGPIGTIQEVVEYPQQFMAVVAYQGRDLLIPLNDTFIQSVDPEAQRFVMRLPEGLLEL